MPGLEPWFPQPASELRSTQPVAAPSSAEDTPIRVWPAERAAEAIAAFDSEALPPPPNEPAVLRTLVANALVLIENGELRPAMTLLRNALMRDSRHAEALRWMAFCLKTSGQLEEAAKCARALCSARPLDEASWFLRGEIAYEMERDADARASFEEALKLASADCPFLFDVYKFLGNANVRSGDFDAAEECYNKAFVLNPTSDALMVNYGTLEIQREQLDAATERFRAAAELNRTNDKAWVGLAIVHRHRGDLSLAWANLETALDCNATNRTAIRLAIEWGAQEKRFDLAVRALKAHLAVDGGDAEMSFALAKILAYGRQFEEALVETERAFSIDPSVPGIAEFFEALRAETRARAMPRPESALSESR